MVKRACDFVFGAVGDREIDNDKPEYVRILALTHPRTFYSNSN